MSGNPHITAIDLRGNGFDADGLYALVQVSGVPSFLGRGRTICGMIVNSRQCDPPCAQCLTRARATATRSGAEDHAQREEAQRSEQLLPQSGRGRSR
jgi:hypothetical protein